MMDFEFLQPIMSKVE